MHAINGTFNELTSQKFLSSSQRHKFIKGFPKQRGFFRIRLVNWKSEPCSRMQLINYSAKYNLWKKKFFLVITVHLLSSWNWKKSLYKLLLSNWENIPQKWLGKMCSQQTLMILTEALMVISLLKYPCIK